MLRGGLDVVPNSHRSSPQAARQGAITITPEYRLLVSEQAGGEHSLEEQLLPYHERAIALPAERGLAPDRRYLEWHEREVFKKK